MKSFKLYIILTILTVSSLQGQQDFLPKSPEVAALDHFVEVPVDGYTGTAAVSIPLLTLESKTITVPVSVAYHTGGVKVAQEASEIGLGWALNAGGVISREIRDKDDFGDFISPNCNAFFNPVGFLDMDEFLLSDLENQVGSPSVFGPNDNYGIYYPRSFCDPGEDGYYPDCFYINQNGDQVLWSDINDHAELDYESDIYTISLMGVSAKFMFKKDKTIMMLSQQDMRVELIEDVWKVTLSNGIIGYFGETDQSIQRTYSENEVLSIDGGAVNCISCTNDNNNGNCEDAFISAWKLERLTSPDGDEITFEYEKQHKAAKPLPSYTEQASELQDVCVFAISQPGDQNNNPDPNNLQTNINECLQQITGPLQTESINIQLLTYDNVNISKISSTRTRCEIQFEYGSRTDIIDSRRLLRLKKYVNGVLHKKVEVNNVEYFTGIRRPLTNWVDQFPIDFSFLIEPYYTDKSLNQRLKLNSIQTFGYEGTALPPYNFIYDDGNEMASKASFSVDEWGYYNGKFNQTALPTINLLVDYPLQDEIVQGIHGTFDEFSFCTHDYPCKSLMLEGADNTVNSTLIESWALNSMTNPTGGELTLTYEPHEYQVEELSQTNSMTEIALSQTLSPFPACPTLLGTYLQAFQIDQSCRTPELEFEFQWKEYEDLDCDANNICTCTEAGPGIAFKVDIYRIRNGLTTLVQSVTPGITTPQFFFSISCGGSFDQYRSYTSIVLDDHLNSDKYEARLVNQYFPQNCSETIPENISAFVNISFLEDLSSFETTKMGGGIRIKSKNVMDPATSAYNIEEFTYENENGSSTGVALNPLQKWSLNPTIGFCTNVVDYAVLQVIATRSSNSKKNTQSRYSSSHIGYSSINKTTRYSGGGGEQSYEEYTEYFVQPYDPLYNLFKEYEGFYDFRNGKTLTQELRENDQVTSRSVYDYTSHIVDSEWSGVPFSFWVNYNKNFSQWVTLDSKTETTYGIDGGSRTVTTTNSYDENFYQIRSTSVACGNTQKTTDFKYAFDFPESDFLVDANIIGVPLETTVNDGLGGGKKTEYCQSGNLILPCKYYDARDDSQWRLLQEITSFYPDGYPELFQNTSNALPTQLTWGEGSKIGLLETVGYGDRISSYTYTDRRQLESHTDFNEIQSTFSYDDLGRLGTKSSNNGILTNEYKYDIELANGGANSVSDIFLFNGESLISESEYNGFGKMTKQTQFAFLHNGGDLTMSTSHDGLGREETVTDPRSGGTTINNYRQGPSSEIRQVTPPNWPQNITFKYSIADCQYVADMTDENGNVTSTSTDIFGRKTKTVDGEGNVTTYTYNDRDQVVTIQPPIGAEYSYTYYPNGLLHTKTIPDKGTHTYTYDQYYQVRTETLPNGKMLTYRYDGTYNDFLRSIDLDGTIIEEYTPYDASLVKDWIGSKAYAVHSTSGITSGAHTVVYKDFDHDFGRPQLRSVSSIDGSYTDVIEYDDLGNVKKSEMNINGPGAAVTAVVTSTFQKGVRLKNINSLINGIRTNTQLQYDGHDWMTTKILGDKIQTIDYGYNGRGWLTSINSINSTYPNEDPCTEPDTEGPIPEPNCKELFAIISNFIIMYDCHKLANGEPTQINISLRKQYLEGAEQTGVTLTEDVIYLNGATSASLQATPDSIYFSAAEPMTNDQTALGLLQTLIDCIENNPELLDELYLFIENSLSTTLDPTNTGEAPTTDTPSPTNNNEDVYGMELHYEEGNAAIGAAPQYNGNISWMEWRSKSEQRHAYGFKYDSNNRLKYASYGEDDESDPDCKIVKSDKYTVRNIQYDALGNINSLVRNGLKDPEAEELVYESIDNLSYTYGGGTSLLSSVTDMSNNLRGFKGAASTYRYDPTGNLISDSQKGISDIAYTYNDLPLKITTSTGTIENYYTSAGEKLKSVITPTASGPNSGVQTRVYLAGAEYVNSTLEAVYTDEGRVVISADGNYPEYYLKDHLGNTRARIADKNQDNLVNINPNDPENDELMSTHHYYPFGMEWDTPAFDANGNNLGESPVKSRYTYNGKEYLDDLNLNLHDYGARYYDPAIARFTTVDPLADPNFHQSGYVYADNNPIRYIDFMGLDATDLIKEVWDATPDDGQVHTYNSEGSHLGSQSIESFAQSNNIDLTNPFTSDSQVDDFLCACIQARSKKEDATLFDIIEDNDYSNVRNVKWGNQRRLELQIKYGSYIYNLFVIGRNPLIEGENFSLSTTKYTKDIRQLFAHTRGSGGKQEYGFVVVGYNGNGNPRRLISISTYDKDAAEYLKTAVYALMGHIWDGPSRKKQKN